MKLIDEPKEIIKKEFFKFLKQHNIKEEYIQSVETALFPTFKGYDMEDIFNRLLAVRWCNCFRWEEAVDIFPLDWDFINSEWRRKLDTKHDSVKKRIIDII